MREVNIRKEENP
jgi:hypothetical protein